MTTLQSQMRRRDVEMVPLFLVRSMFAVMVAALALTSFAVLTHRPLVGVPAPSPVLSQIAVRLVADADGTVTALGPDGEVLERSDQNRAGFLGVVQGAMTLERHKRGLPEDAPVRVARLADGRIEVIDDTTGWSADLNAHGRDNIAAFARLVP